MVSSESKVRLSINLLGGFQVSRDGRVLTGFSTDKTRALLAYLVTESDRQHRRQTLAGLLWPKYPEQAARTSLRTALANLRQVIGDHQAEPPFLSISRQDIAIGKNSGIWVDVVALSRQIDPKKLDQFSLSQLEEAVNLYQGRFLEGFSLADSAPFDEWILINRERLKLQMMAALDHLIVRYKNLNELQKALDTARRRVELDPWQEPAQRELMRLLAANNRRTDALTQYESCRRLLAEELGVEPEPATTQLYQDIRDGKLPSVFVSTAGSFANSNSLPPFLVEGIQALTEKRVFVGREQELERLRTHFQDTVDGQGQVLFVVGGAGRGKSALLEEFTRQVLSKQSLSAATGFCNAYSGSGDPYLPFRQVLEMLTGDVGELLAAGRITKEQAVLLWQNLPAAAKAIVEVGPDLIETFLDGHALLERTRAAVEGETDWLRRLDRLVKARAASQILVILEQSILMEQYLRVLERISRHVPLLIILEDLHWADRGSIDLLMHLGRHLKSNRILIVGAYRPDEVAASREGDRQAITEVVNEIKSLFGNIIIDLAVEKPTASWKFVNNLLDAEPNRLNKTFRREIYNLTRGHPLFTIETLRMLQEQGNIVQDSDGCWMEGRIFSWDQVPVRVEAIIQKRISRLDPFAHELLTIASVQGEDFTADVVAQVLNKPKRQVLRTLAQELGRKHRLLLEQGELDLGGKHISRFRFSHHLIQRYVYNSLSPGECRLLHEQVARAIEGLFAHDLETVVIQLAFHYSQTEAKDKAIHYLAKAGHQARKMYDGQQAVHYYTEALALTSNNSEERFHLLEARSAVYDILAHRVAQREDIDAMQVLGLSLGDKGLYCDALLALSDFYLATDIFRAREPALQARALAQEIGDAVREAHALRRLSWEGRLGANFRASRGYLEEAAAHFNEAGLPGEAASCLFMLARRLPGSAKHVFELEAAERAMTLSLESGDYRLQAVARKNLAIAYSNQGRDVPALPLAEKALEMQSDLGNSREQCSTQDVLGVILARLGQREKAAVMFQRCLTLSEEIGFDWGILGAVFGFWNYLYIPAGEPEAFLTFIDKRLEHAFARGHDWLCSFLLWMKTLGLAYLGQYENALLVTQEKAYQATEDDLVSNMFVLQFAGLMKAEQGDFENARQDLEQALLLAQKTSDRYVLSFPLIALANLTLYEAEQDLLRKSIRQARTAIEVTREVGEERGLADALDLSVRLHLTLGVPDQAYADSVQAIQLLQSTPWLPNPQKHLHTHYLVLRTLKREAESKEYLQHAYERVRFVADRLSDNSNRQSWMSKVRVNREILRHWNEIH